MGVFREPMGDTSVSTRTAADTRVGGRFPENTMSRDGSPPPAEPVLNFLSGFEGPVIPTGPDPIWGDRFKFPQWELDVDRGEAAVLVADGAEGPAHPDPGTGRRPSDPAATERLRNQHLSQVYTLKMNEIYSKQMKCSYRMLGCSKCGSQHLDPRKCGSRLCPFEARRLAAERTAIYSGLAKKAKNPRFLTLTQPLVPYEEPAGLREGIKRLRKGIARLIRRKVFRMVWGGIYSFEIVTRPGGFHIHAHLLLDALWIENRNEMGRPLEAAWKECLEGVGTVFEESSKGRSILWIEQCDEKTIKEVLKYTVKGASLEDADCGEAAPSSVHTGAKIHIPEELRFDEVPFEGLHQLVEVLEGRVHMIEPIKGWRGAIGRYRKNEEEMSRKRAWELNFCFCGGELVLITSGPWGDPRLVYVDGKHELREPPPGIGMPSYWLKKKAE